jgi:hypothetical protein
VHHLSLSKVIGIALALSAAFLVASCGPSKRGNLANEEAAGQVNPDSLFITEKGDTIRIAAPIPGTPGDGQSEAERKARAEKKRPKPDGGK